ncbi:hypothetical protein AsAng_0043050 [Aureispira anguillae]|uniref:Uncharacterized protein n=1 Tax=Aureispira anguillae TaxID=2864201 RepID=A0A916DUQ6_9BACT|nr:hypothetical protein AsAng_0043050 [Aureispira anguillae]
MGGLVSLSFSENYCWLGYSKDGKMHCFEQELVPI